MYLAQTYYPKAGSHYGSIHHTQYDAAFRVMFYISNGDSSYQLSEDGILATHDKTIFKSGDGEVIASGHIKGVYFQIVKIAPKTIMNFSI